MAATAGQASTRQPAGKVARRRVFYIPGFDPFPPRRYRELYRLEGARQAAISGHAITLVPRAGAEQGAGPDAPRPFGWDVRATVEGAEVEAGIEVLVWSDIVARSMGAGVGATYLQMLRTSWIYASSGALWRLMRLRKGPVIAALYPLVVLLAQAAVAVLAAVALWRLGGGFGAAGAMLGALAGLGAGYGVLRGFRAIDNRIFAYYLQHDYAFTAQHHGANPMLLDARLSEFADRIRAALADEHCDEVLVVGHSSGAHLAVMVLAEVIRRGDGARTAPLSLLTLGQVVPMVSFLPRADRLRADLHLLAASDALTWVDVSAPGDGCSFALCDPVAVSGVSPAAQRWPLVISAAFTKTLRPETWRRLRWRFFRLHFQYLCSFDNPGDYDYFAITAGPRTLGARFAGRRPSRSRIVTPLSPHRGMDRAAA